MNRRAALGVIGVLIATSSALVIGLQLPAGSPPSFVDVRASYRPSDVRLLDRHGEVVHELRVDAARRRLEWVPLADISPALQAAVIAAEDRRFYRHHGVDGRAFIAAAVHRLTGGRLRGASTLSMQLATLLDPTLRRSGGPRTLRQKWRQMCTAWAIERQWSKPQIIEAYLNLVTFRGELQGVGAAASVLFGKAPHGITAAEGLVLAVLLKAPNAGQTAVVNRASAVRGAPDAAATHAEISRAAQEALSAPPGMGPRVALAPHVARRLVRRNDAATAVRSTLDAALQRAAADSLRRNLLLVRDRRVQDGAVLVADNATGDVLAYVGSSSDLSSARFVDGVQAKRQAGSALKPFLYGLALDRRLLTAASLIEDTPLELAVAGGLYRPQNYDEQFRGLVTVRTALSSSLNIPAVRTLLLVGDDAFARQLRRLGFESMVEPGDYYGPSLALGSADVSLWEMVNAYRTLANAGAWSPLRLTPDEDAGAPRRLFSEAVAFLISDILADRESRSTTFGLENPLVTRFWTAVKTGTSKEMRDNWCIGYSRRYTVGVWVGNFSGEPMRDVSGVTGAAPIWLEVMDWLHRDTPSVPPAPPEQLVAQSIAFADGIEPDRTEWFVAGTEPQQEAQRLAAARPRILAPASGAIVALDPDIPAGQQRLLFQAQGAETRMRWQLDGADLGAATRVVTWDPRPGRHRLALVDGDRHPVTTVGFVVRGAAGAARN